MNSLTFRTRNTVFSLPGLICVLAFLLLAFPFSRGRSSDARPGFVSTETKEGRLAVFDNVWDTIDDRYYDPKFGGVDWTGRSTAYRQAAASAKNSRELYAVLRRMIGTLNDPHTRVYPPEEKFDWWRPRFVTIGVVVREIEGTPTVVQVDPKSEAARAGIRSGDQIAAVDGVSVRDALQKKLDHETPAGGSRTARFRAVATLFEGDAETPILVSWKNKSGKTKSQTLTRYWNQYQLGFRISRKQNFVIVETEGFTQELVIKLLRALSDKLANANGVVLDLRRNGGGDADAMAEIADLFLPKGIDLGSFTDRAGSTLQLIAHGKSVFPPVSKKSARPPLAVLVSERTSSAAEILAAALQAQHRAHIIGTPTCGCVLAIRSRYTLPDDGVLDVSEFDYRTAAGLRLEGRGVQPEVIVMPQRRDLYAKRDRALETAVSLMTEDKK